MGRIDIQLDNNDIVIDNDLILVESDDQHIVDTINACPGWWKENFADGVGIIKYLKGRNVQQELARSMKLNLQSDGYDCQPQISYDNTETLIINTNVSI
jgi:hypothetical protein